MTALLPLNAAKIGLEWPIEQGGFGVTAKTDKAGSPIVGFYPLNADGLPSGQPIEYAHSQITLRIVAGYDDQEKAILVFADANLSREGLALRIVMPMAMIERGYDRYLFVPWSAPTPLTFGR